MARQRSRSLWWGTAIWTVLAAGVGTGLMLAGNAAADVDGKWPWKLEALREHPFRWVTVLTLAGAVIGLLWTWSQRRIERSSDQVKTPNSVVVAANSVNGPAIAAETINYHAAPVPVAIPGRVVNLPPRNRDFTGRDDLFVQLDSGLADGAVAVVAVHGLGGIGKSQVALEFAHRGVVEKRWWVAWWIRAETPLTLAEDLAALGPGLGITRVADQEQAVAAVRAVLRERPGWLLVFDNAPNADAIRDWLPDGGALVITSRSLLWGGLAGRVGVTEFTRVESVEYLRKVTGEAGPLVAELAGLLSDLPLALAQAAAYMQQAGGLSVAKYVALYRNQQTAGHLLAVTTGDGYPESVATTWLMHFAWLERYHPAALELLRLCAFLEPDEINLTVLLRAPDLLAGQVTGLLSAACADPLEYTGVIAALAGSGLVTRLDDDRIRIHRLVSQVTRQQLGSPASGDVRARADHTVSLLAALMPQTPWEPQTWPLCADIAAHITAAAEYANPVTDKAVALARLGQYLRARAEFAAAKTVLQQALEIMRTEYGPQHPEVAAALGNLGIVQADLGELAEAKATQLQALDINEAGYGPNHAAVALTLGNLGNTQQELGEFAEAKASHLRAVRIMETVHGPQHPEVALTLGNLGNVQRQLGDLAEAKATLLRALHIMETSYGQQHPQVAIALTNLGIVQWQLGDVTEAKASLLRALSINEAAYGPQHPEVAATLTNLGIVQRLLGEAAEAKASLLRALEIKVAVFGPQHPQVATTLSNLGNVQRPMGIRADGESQPGQPPQ